MYNDLQIRSVCRLTEKEFGVKEARLTEGEERLRDNPDKNAWVGHFCQDKYVKRLVRENYWRPGNNTLKCINTTYHVAVKLTVWEGY